MTLSRGKIYLGLLAFALSAICVAVSLPDAQMANAQAAIASADRAHPQGAAAQALSEARQQYFLAQNAFERKKYRDAERFAEQAQASASLALARARLSSARQAVDEKSVRNAELRRQLLVLPEAQL